jgi:hypothetical protein
MDDPLHIIGSPKRKRALADTGCRAASPLRPRTEGSPPDTVAAPARGDRGASPQSHMSEEFRYLHIHPPQGSRQRLSFRGKAPPVDMQGGGDGERIAQALDSAGTNELKRQSGPVEQSVVYVPADISMAFVRPSSDSASDTVQLATPSTPSLKPISPADSPRTISPLHPLAMDISPDGELHVSPTSKRPRSPPLSDAASPWTWTPAEITGHLLNDPLDDGTGINGIGFRPTPAVAQQRAARRRQQVADWKNREAREARSRRAERRGRGVPLTPGKKDVGIGSANMSDGMERRRVRFVEG